MAGGWQSLTQQVSDALARISAATSEASGAAGSATAAAQSANAAAEAATSAAANANEQAAAAQEETYEWNNATVIVTTLDPDEEATVEVKEVDGRMQFKFGIPRGETGETGAKGDTGESGVTFRISGTVLNITTN